MSILRQTFCFSLVAALLLITAQRLLAPIQEVPESPTPVPEQSAKPKPKRTIKPKVTSERSESSTKRQTPSPLQSKATPQRNLFDGTWTGFLNDDHRTLFINSAGTVVTEKSVKWGTATWPATCDGVSMRCNTAGGCSWTLTPNPDGKTAPATATCPGFLGIGAGTWSAVFRRTSP